MGKTKKSLKKKKKTNVLKTLFKIIGICSASVIGFVGASIGVFALFGGFNPKVVSLEGMKFEQQAYVLSGYVDQSSKKVLVGNKDKDGNIFESVKLLPTNEDATKLDVVLSGGRDLVVYQEGNKVGSPLKFEIQQNKSGNLSYNKTGEFKLTARQDEDNRIAETKIFIESAVQSFNLSAQNIANNFDENKIYPGNSFTLSVVDIFPSNALDKPENCNNEDNEFYKTYGVNYFNKQVLFLSSKEKVATVNPQTGEVSVVGEGDFTITCYMPKTYKDNANFPSIQDENFLEILSDTSKFYSVSKHYTSKSIEVAGIRATTSTIENLNVFETYTYSTKDNSQGQNRINLDLSLIPPDSDFKESQLSYKLGDIQILEGYKNDNKFYIFGGQSYAGSENDINENIIMSKHFTIKKEINPLSWSVRVESYTSQDIYLIARIAKDKQTFVLPDGDELIDTDREDVFYAFIKVKPNKIVNTETLSFNQSRILAQFDAGQEDKMLYISKDKILDLTSEEIFTNPKTTQTYKIVKYFVSSGSEFVACKDTFDGLSPELQLYSKKTTINQETGKEEVLYVEDDNGKYIKIANDANITGLTDIEIYAAIFEFPYKIDSKTGDYILDENGNRVPDYDYALSADNKYTSTREKSNSMVITVSKFIDFSDFNVTKNNQNLSFDDLKNGITVNTGDVIEISFETTNPEGLFNAKDLFTIKCASGVENLISAINREFSSTSSTQKINFSALNEGMGVISIQFNGEDIVLKDADNEIGEFNITVEKNEVKSIVIASNDGIIDDNNQINFIVTQNNNEVSFKAKKVNQVNAYQTSGKFDFDILVEGGTIATQLRFGPLSGDIYLNTSVDVENKGKLEIQATNLTLQNSGDNFKATFSIYPHKLCDNLQFYIYTLVDGETVKSQTITISISGLQNSDIEQNVNSNNNITINGENYQKVVGGEAFNLVKTDTVDGYLTFNNDSDEKLHELFAQNLINYWNIPTQNDEKLYTSAGFADVKEPTVCKIILKPSFWNESDYLTLNFYIIPRYVVRTTTLELNASESKTTDELKTYVEFIERTYNNNNRPANAYIGNIKEENINTNISHQFFKINSDGEKDAEIEDAYTAPNSFMGETEKILCEITYTPSGQEAKVYSAYINVIIQSNSEVEQIRGVSSNWLNNGEIINLAELFKIVKVSDKTQTGTVTKVTLSKDSYNLLKQYGIKFYNNDKNESKDAGNEVSETENMSSNEWKSLLDSIVSIKIPEDLNIYEINDLSASIVATIESQEQTKNNHEFDLSFKLTELSLTLDSNVDKTVYILSDELSDLKNKMIQNYVIRAVESTNEGSQEDKTSAIQVVKVEETSDTGKITFTLNSIKKIYNYQILTGLVSKEDGDFVCAKAYSVENLIKLSDAYSSNTTISTAFSNATFKEIKDKTTDVDYIIQNGGKILAVTNIEGLTGVTIIFNMLEREIEVSGFDFGAFAISSEIGNNVYSNVEYEIFNTDTLNKINDNQLKVEIVAYEMESASEYKTDAQGNKIICADLTYSYENGIVKSFIATNYAGEAKLISIEVSIHSQDYKGIVLKKETTLNSLLISPKYSGETYDGNQVLLNGFEYNLKDYFSISFNGEEYFTLTEKPTLECWINDSLLSDLENYTPSVTQDTIVNLNIKLNDFTLKTIPFYVKVYTLETISSGEVYFAGQTINDEELRKLVNIKDTSGAVVENADLKNKLIFTGSKTLHEGDNSITVYFGKIQTVLTIIAQRPTFSETQAFEAYPDTKITKYVSCYVSSGEKTRNLVLNYMFVDNVNVQTNGDIQSLYKDAVLVATLNTKNGELLIDAINFDHTVEIYAYIEGTDPTNASTRIMLTFNVKTISKTSVSPQDLYVGDQNYELSQFAYFGAESDKKIPDFEIYSISDNGQNLSYTFTESILTNEILINKNGKTLAKLTFNANNNRSVLQTTSELDSLTIVVRGYLKLSSSNYTLESLRTNYVVITINVTSIKVNFSVHENSDGTETKLNTILANGKEYYVLDSSINYELSPSINAGDNALKITSLTYSSNYDNFIGKVNEEIQLSFIKKLQDLNIETSALLLPNNNDKINISKAGDIFKFTSNNNKLIVDYIFVTLNYSVQAYNSTVNICLRPKLNIAFEFDDENTNYATVYSPSTYKLATSGSLLSFNKTLEEGQNIKMGEETYSFDISFSQTCASSDETNFDFSNQASRNHTLKLLYNTSSGYNISITSKSSNQTGNFYYAIRIAITYDVATSSGSGTSQQIDNFDFFIKVVDINTVVKNLDLSANNQDNPIIVNENKEYDLKEYIFVNNKCISNSSIENETNEEIQKQLRLFSQNTIFTAQDNEIYSLSSDGKFTPKVDAFDTQIIQFSLFNVQNDIYIKGQELVVLFKQNGSDTSENYSLLKGDVKYFYLSKQEDDSTKTVVVDMCDAENVSFIADDSLTLNFNIKKYVFSGMDITDSSQFDVQTNLDVTTYSFMGSALLTVTKLNNGYKLEVANNLSGDLEFALSPIYSTLSASKTCKVLSDVQISVTYSDPVIYEGENHQNVVSGSNFDLNAIASINKEGLSLNYEIVEGANAYVLLNENILSVSENLQQEAYLKIKASYGNIIRYINIKLVPKTKTLTTSNTLYCINGEIINLINYIKIYSLIGFDSQNLPEYELLTSFEEKQSDNSFASISDPYNYVINAEKTVKINNLTYTFKTTTLSLSFECYLGERVDVREKIISTINASILSNKNVSLSFEKSNGLISDDGIYEAKEVVDAKNITILINGVEHTLTIKVNDLAISVNYNNSVLKQNTTTNQAIRYENIYAGQNEASSNYISISNTNFANNLQFSITSIMPIENALGEKYDESKFSTQNSSICGKNSILVSYDGKALFAIGQDSFVCYSDLKYEVLINFELTLSSNTIVKNNFNVRLLPVEVTYSSLEKNITKENLLGGTFNLYGLITANTKAKENNINLNENIKFYNDSVDASNLIDNGNLTVDGTKLSYTIIADFGGVQYQFKLNYANSNNFATTLFVSNLTNTASCLKEASNASIIGVSSAPESEKINYTIVVNSGKIYYQIYDCDVKLLMIIDSAGNITDKAERNFKVNIFASNGNIVEVKQYASTTTKTQISLNKSGLNDQKASFVTENGANILELIAGKQVDLTNFLNGASVSGSMSNVIERVGESNAIKPNNVSEITYGYFDAVLGDISTRVYVKVYPYTLAKNYIDDFKYTQDSVLVGTNVAISKNDTFKTMFVSENDIDINLADYVKKVSNININLPVSYSIMRIVSFNETSYSIVPSENQGEYLTLNSNTLTIKSKGTYYIYLKATIESGEELIFAFRILQIKDNSLSTISVENNSYFDLTSIVKVVATAQDKAKSGAEDIDMFRNLNFSLKNSFNSLIKSNILYISEKDFSNITNTCEITLNYAYSDIINKSLSIVVSQNSETYNSSISANYPYFKYQNKLYEECWLDQNNVTKLNENISTIKNAKIDGEEYSVTVETGKISYNQSEIENISYYNISNKAIVLRSTALGLGVGTILFLNPNYTELNYNKDDPTTYKYISENKVGIFYLTIEVETIVSGISIFKEINYKLNNYSITKNGSVYEYSLNGTKVENSLKFSLVLVDDNYNFVKTIIAKDSENQEILISLVAGKNSISANGITLNTQTGVITGEKTIESVKMYVKAYVQQDNYSYGENYVLFEI